MTVRLFFPLELPVPLEPVNGSLRHEDVEQISARSCCFVCEPTNGLRDDSNFPFHQKEKQATKKKATSQRHKQRDFSLTWKMLGVNGLFLSH
jgi:hypothetical protein